MAWKGLCRDSWGGVGRRPSFRGWVSRGTGRLGGGEDSRVLALWGQFCFQAMVEEENGSPAAQCVLCPSPPRIENRPC